MSVGHSSPLSPVTLPPHGPGPSASLSGGVHAANETAMLGSPEGPVQPGSRLLLISAASAVTLHISGCVRWLLISAASSAAFLGRAAVRLGTGPSPFSSPLVAAPWLSLRGGLNSEDPGVVDLCSFPLSSPPCLVSPLSFASFSVLSLPVGLSGRLGRIAFLACLVGAAGALPTNPLWVDRVACRNAWPPSPRRLPTGGAAGAGLHALPGVLPLRNLAMCHALVRWLA